MEKKYCPECGTPLEFAYEKENGEKVYYCPEGNEYYTFSNKGEYEYATCLFDGRRFCTGTAK